MVKNWLIRTKNNHILGPVSREKIRELISNGSIKGDDEICAGNGYWIYVREQDLVAKYILNNEEQGFNPVQEADPVLALSPMQEDLEYPGDEEKLPSDDDLAYPDQDGTESQADITTVGFNLSELHQEEEAPSPEEVEKKKRELNKLTQDVLVPKLKNRRKQKAPTPKKQVKSSLLSGKLLIGILLFILILVLIALANRSKVINEVINQSSMQLNILPDAYAQNIETKKKSGLTH